MLTRLRYKSKSKKKRDELFISLLKRVLISNYLVITIFDVLIDLLLDVTDTKYTPGNKFEVLTLS